MTVAPDPNDMLRYPSGAFVRVGDIAAIVPSRTGTRVERPTATAGHLHEVDEYGVVLILRSGAQVLAAEFAEFLEARAWCEFQARHLFDLEAGA